MENKDVNITFKLNMNILIATVMLFIVLGMIIFCACYNLPIFKRVREILKSELTKSDVEAFSMPSMKNILDTPTQMVNDLNDILKKKEVKGDKEKKEKKEPKLKKPVVEGFFTNIRPN